MWADCLEYQIYLGIIAALLGLISFFPYLKDIVDNKTRPHSFTWFIWGVLQLVVFFAQTSHGGGPGAWAVAAGAVVYLTIFVISLFRGEKQIVFLDVASLSAALLGIGLWTVTKDPLVAVVIATIVDAVGFIPTFRKAYGKPQEETAITFALSGASFAISLFALQAINLTTVLYPASLVITDFSFVAILIIRRRQIRS